MHYIGIFHCGHLENHPKWRVEPKISSVNILVLDKGVPMSNIIPFAESPYVCIVTPPGP